MKTILVKTEKETLTVSFREVTKTTKTDHVNPNTTDVPTLPPLTSYGAKKKNVFYCQIPNTYGRRMD